MTFDMFCPSCNITLPMTAGRCTTCGNVATLAPRTVVNGGTEQYTIDSVLGIGGMGIVYRTIEATTGRSVVVKELYVGDPADLPDARRRFRREASIQASITHTAFPAGFGYFDDANLGNREFMAMEFVEGEDLEKVLSRQPSGQMDENEVLEIGIRVCDGLEVMHTHRDPAGNPDPLVHRDIKPANLILTTTDEIKILDLGIARAVRQSTATAARQTQAGTSEYAMPEVVLGNPSTKSDIGALAATMYHLVTGTAFPPLDWDTWLTMVDNLPGTWRPVFRRALAKDENLRHRSVGEFKQDLIGLLPPSLRQAYAGAGAPAPVQPALQGVSIAWKSSQAAAMINPGEYRQPVAGRVMMGIQAVPGVTIIPLITDLHQVGAPGTRQTTSLHGDFTLAIPDVTVPVANSRREIEIIVEDPNTGAELFRDNVVINRPGMGARAAVQAGYAGAAVGHGIAVPFQIAGRGIAAPFRGIRNQWRWFQALLAARKAVAQAAGKLPWYRRGWQQVRGWFAGLKGPRLLLALAILFAVLTLIGVAKHWTWLWTICPYLTWISIRFRSFAKTGQAGRQPPQRDISKIMMPMRSTAWVGVWLIYVLSLIFKF